MILSVIFSGMALFKSYFCKPDRLGTYRLSLCITVCSLFENGCSEGIWLRTVAT